MDKLLSKVLRSIRMIKAIYRTLSPERVLVVWISLLLSTLLLFSALMVVNIRHTTVVPSLGGTIKEGIVGTPRFINPVLATSDQDLDMVSLVFAGLTKQDAKGNIILDMADSITESDDKLHYDVVLKSSAKFHDGKPVTSDDVIYTISLIQDPNVKSPYRFLFEGVTIDKTSDTEFVINLKKPYPLLMQALTIGILPKHVWKNLSVDQISLSDYNIHAIGSGPFMISKVNTNSGIPTSFVLIPNKQYTLGRSYLDEIYLVMYQNEKYALQGFQNGEVNRIHGISPDKLSTLDIATSSIETSILPRTFSVFFNPNKLTLLSDKNVRQALNMAINKQAIVDEVLKGYGHVIETPYPFDLDQPTSTYNPEQAKVLLSQSKYIKKNASSTINIDLATANSPEMKAVAEMIKNDWAAIGVNANIQVYEFSDLNQSIIKDRDYEALLFGTITKTPSDLYAFWHSSQRAYPGLNISNYVSNTLDKNLTTLRESDDELERENAYEAVKNEFIDEVPGIFLYVPELIYIANDKATTPLPDVSLDNSSRFLLVNDWYRYTERVWGKTYYQPLVSLLNNIIH